MIFKTVIQLFFVLFISCTIKEDKKSMAESTSNEHLKYLKQKPPSMTPEVFAPNIISLPSEHEFGSVFSEDGTEFFYSVNINFKEETRYTRLVGDEWSEPRTILSHELYGFNDPFLSPDEKQLYFISQMSLDGTYKKDDHDIWYVQKNENGWSAPINAGSNINTKMNEYYISFTHDTTMYFSSNEDIYLSKKSDGKFQQPISLGDSINTPGYEADVFVDPDETYLIFCAKRSEGFGAGDLYISFKKEDGSWTKAKNMGEPVNTEHHELCPFVSKDGKYLFYTSRGDIYWVDAKIIEQYRN